jgi:isopenicillin N synthase-like dioxygenase
VQVGEALQIHSGGALRATPHYVRAPRPGPTEVSRSTFALFLQPDVACMMTAPEGASQSKVAVGAWQPGQTFGGFWEACS